MAPPVEKMRMECLDHALSASVDDEQQRCFEKLPYEERFPDLFLTPKGLSRRRGVA